MPRAWLKAAFSRLISHIGDADRSVKMDNFSKGELEHLPNLLSAPRFSTYRRYSNDNCEEALRLYLWNLRISSALIVPLHIMEVALRNAIADAITAVYGEAWPHSTNFICSLPNPKQRQFYNPQEQLKKLKKKHSKPGKIVADLSLVFWERMLARRYYNNIWKKNFREVFPHAPEEQDIQDLQCTLSQRVEKCRELRNRIAHHEPIFMYDLSERVKFMEEIVRWRSDHAADWLIKINETPELLKNDPRDPKQI